MPLINYPIKGILLLINKEIQPLTYGFNNNKLHICNLVFLVKGVMWKIQ